MAKQKAGRSFSRAMGHRAAQQIKTKPLSPTDQDDRVRMVFGLTSNDTLPDVDDETLQSYHGHLSTQLAFPFAARYGEEYGRPEQVMVIGLGDPHEPIIEEMYDYSCALLRG